MEDALARLVGAPAETTRKSASSAPPTTVSALAEESRPYPTAPLADDEVEETERRFRELEAAAAEQSRRVSDVLEARFRELEERASKGG